VAQAAEHVLASDSSGRQLCSPHTTNAAPVTYYVVVKHLPGKCEALCSIPSSTKPKKKKKRQKRKMGINLLGN
jgi:hypothetical protein